MQKMNDCGDVGRCGRRRGFTLIEILIVIAIIALLAAILFPVFARARENARRASCLTNLKQIALANQQYIDDYDGVTMRWRRGTNGRSMPELLEPYVKNNQIFTCPSISQITDAGRRRGFGYAVNVAALASNGNASGPIGCNVALTDPPAACDLAASSRQLQLNATRTMLCLDTRTTGTAEDWLDAGYYTQRIPESETTSRAVSDRHLDGTNIAYYDGHVKWVPFSKVFTDNDGLPLGYGGTTTSLVPSARPHFNPNRFWTFATEE